MARLATFPPPALSSPPFPCCCCLASLLRRRQAALKALHIQLSQQQPKRGIRSWLGDLRAQQLVQRLAVAFGKSSMPSSEPWPLRIERIATSSIHHCGKRMPRRMRQSGSVLRKLIRSVAAAWFWSGEANGKERFLGTKPELAAAPPLLGHTSNGPWLRPAAA